MQSIFRMRFIGGYSGYRGEIFIYFVDFPGMIRHILSVCANSSGVERIYSAYSLGVRNGVYIPLQMLLLEIDFFFCSLVCKELSRKADQGYNVYHTIYISGRVSLLQNKSVVRLK